MGQNKKMLAEEFRVEKAQKTINDAAIDAMHDHEFGKLVREGIVVSDRLGMVLAD